MRGLQELGIAAAQGGSLLRASGAVSDQEGWFQFSRVPPYETYQVYGKMNSASPFGSLPARQTRVSAPGNLTDLGHLELENAHVVSGRVILPGGPPIPSGVEIALAREETADSQVVGIGPEAEFFFTGIPPKSIAISLNIPGYFLSPENPHLDRLNGDAILGKVEQNVRGRELRAQPGQFKRAPDLREFPWDLQPWLKPFPTHLSPSL